MKSFRVLQISAKLSVSLALIPLLLVHATSSSRAAEPKVTRENKVPSEPLTVWFAAPARGLSKPREAVDASGTQSAIALAARCIDFHESLPIGNGRLGAMDCGGVDLERIILNESSVWSGGDYDANKYDAYRSLPELREKLFAGDVAAAEKILNGNFGWVGKRFDPTQFGSYQTLGDLLVKFPDSDAPASDYRRELNLRTGVVTTSYTRNGIHFTRELVIPKKDEVIALRLKADKPGALSCLATLTRAARVTTSVEGGRYVAAGQLEFDWPGGKGVSYRTVLAAQSKGGSVAASDQGLEIKDADEVTLLISAGTSMKQVDFASLVSARLDAALHRGFDTMRDEAGADHQAYMDRCRLVLPETDSAKLPTPERVKLAQTKTDPTLDALYFQFGRHLLISGSRPDSQLPNNLQGIWAEEIRTPWRGDFHSNINVQMNYWPAEVTNLSSCHLPLFDLIRKVAKKGEATAKAYYNAPGWLCFHTQNPWGFSAPTNMQAGSGSTCGAWLCQHIWTHYNYTRDQEFLKQNYPVLREASRFFLATLVKNPADGKLVTAPSNSPENAYVVPRKDGVVQKSSLTYGATYDQQIIRDLFQNTAAAARILGTDADLVAQLDETRGKLAPTRVNSEGRIMEWIEDYQETEIHHRHTSPLWGLYPGSEINPSTPELFKGARLLLERRGDASTGWSMAWKANFWARLHDGDRSRKLLSMLIGGGAPNLFCLHAPFQIDGNFGGTAAIAEMLLQTQDGSVTLLPALPSAWSSGKVYGLCAPNRLTVDIEWEAGKLTSATIHGAPGVKVPVVTGDKRINAEIPPSGVLTVSGN